LKKNHLLLSAFLLITVFASLKTAPKAVLIRFKNDTNTAITQLTARPGGQEVTHYDIVPGGLTPFVQIRETHPYFQLTVISGTDTFRLLPQDYFEKDIVRDGKYTFYVTLKQTGGKKELGIQMKKATRKEQTARDINFKG
jgi:hypothetical protein